MANEPTKKWREPTLDACEEGSSSESGGSTEYESEEPLTPRPQKRPRGEEEDDPDFDPRGETRGSRVEPRVINPDEDIMTQSLGVRTCSAVHIN